MAAPNAHVKVAGAWKRVKKIHTKVAGAWKTVRKAYVKVGSAWKLTYQNRIAVNLTISANTLDYNAYTAAGSPADGVPRDVILTINAGVFVGSNSTASAGLQIGGPWPTGSTFSIVNSGYICGKGGAGGAGGGYGGGAAGSAGGNALQLHSSIPTVSINNSNYILGGGGGGGGGGGAGYWSGYSEWVGGGGGGGGCGYNDSSGGGNGGAYMPVYGAYYTRAAANGSNGTTSGGGAGGVGAQGYNYVGGEYPQTYDLQGGSGGTGGTWGTAGNGGATATNGGWYQTPTLYGGGAGGAAGKAIDLNGSSISWVAGGTYPNVQGAVS